MDFILTLGVIISLVGLLGLMTCVFKGIKIKRLERVARQDQTALNNLLGRLYILNMISLSFSFLGLLLVIVGIIFKN